MLSWTRIDWSMKMRETSRGVDKKLHVNNYLDTGGITATSRHAEELRKNGFTVKVINYTSKDPDDIFMEIMKERTHEDAIAYTEWIVQNNSILASQFEVNRVMSKFESDYSELQINTVKNVQLILSNMEEGIEKTFVKKSVAEKLGVRPEELGWKTD